MIESNHKSLIRPPKGTKAIVLPVCGAVRIETIKDKEGKPTGDVQAIAPMKSGYAAEAARKWPVLPRVVGEFIHQVGARTLPLTYVTGDGFIGLHGHGGGTSYHVLMFPTRMIAGAPLQLDLVRANAERLEALCAHAETLKGGKIVFPQFRDTEAVPQGVTWEAVKAVIAPYLKDDRFVAIAGTGGRVT